MRDESMPGDAGHADLLGLLRGQLTNEQVHEADAHLDGCSDCRAELRELAVGHALLTRTAATVRSSRTATPPAAVPPLRAITPPRRWVRPVALAAAAAVLVAGTAATTTRLVRPEPTPPPQADVSGRLQPLSGSGAGEVLMAEHGTTVLVTIRTHDLPTAGRGEFYYAWLLEPDTNKMLPLGQVGPGGSASFELPDSLVDRYVAVDVSLEHDDGDPAHSVTSVLRGDYTPPTSRS